MIVALENRYEIVRVILQTEWNDVYVCKSLSLKDRSLHTLIKIKDKSYRERFLRVMAQVDRETLSERFLDMTVSENHLILIFPYQNESRLFYYKTLYWRSFSERLEVASALLYQLMASNMPAEFLFFMLEEENLNISKDKKIYFNLFADVSLLPETVSAEIIVQKTATVVYRILSDGMKVTPSELQLFKRKLSGNAFTNLSSVYAEVKKLPAKLASEISMFSKIRQWLKGLPAKFAGPATLVFFIALFCFSIYYTYQMVERSRIVPAVAKTDATVIYTGMYKIGTVVLEDEGPSQAAPANEKKEEAPQ